METFKSLRPRGEEISVIWYSVITVAMSFLSCASATDFAASKFKLYFSESEPDLQRLIDMANSRLLVKTTIGRQQCTQIFGASQAQLADHLGVSPAAAARISYFCQGAMFRHQTPFSVSTAEAKSKATLIPGDGRRLFALACTDSDKVLFDSWTDDNRTFHVAPASYCEQAPGVGTNLQDLITVQTSHENAIYLDAKGRFYSAEALKNYSTIQKNQKLWMEHPTEKLAAMNPLIAAALGSLRAFQIEYQQAVKELKLNVLYPTDLKNFLNGACHKSCVEDVVAYLAKNFLPISVPLLALNPIYLQQKLNPIYLQERLKNLSPERAEIYRSLLFTLSESTHRFIRDTYKNFAFFDLLATNQGPSLTTVQAGVQQLLEEDLTTLKSKDGRELIDFLSRPLLGLSNTRFAGGARPRIRPGGH